MYDGDGEDDTKDNVDASPVYEKNEITKKPPIPTATANAGGTATIQETVTVRQTHPLHTTNLSSVSVAGSADVRAQLAGLTPLVEQARSGSLTGSYNFGGRVREGTALCQYIWATYDATDRILQEGKILAAKDMAKTLSECCNGIER